MERINPHGEAAGAAEGCGPTRARLLETAVRLFAEKGFEGTSVRAITAEAGCNLAAVNYHFGGKDQLYEEIFHLRLKAIREQRLAIIRSTRAEEGEGISLEALLRAFATAFLEPFMEASDGLTWRRLMWREMVEPHLRQGMFAAEVITPVHEELAAALIPACPGLDLETARRCTYSLVGQLVHFMRLERYFDGTPEEDTARLPMPEVVDHVVRFSASGIRAMAARETGTA
jgi:TetR/AcrR family transcriptional regulator, regulator of cefoperazone and chloramphenicol sensitivity